jgi:UDP-2,3-diacylglucosamine hydrolase
MIMDELTLIIPDGKKVCFASDFHLGSPEHDVSLERERKIVRWLNSLKQDVHTIFILGDVFDFWFEYHNVIPKGYARLLGCLAELRDSGIGIIFFTGNHDMWMFDYFPREFGIPVYREPISVKINDTRFLIGHGDGLGPGDRKYKIIKKFFEGKVSQWMFRWIHPDLGVPLANYLSKNSRDTHLKNDLEFLGDREWLLQYCREVEQKEHHDVYIFGHRHLPLDFPINDHCRYMNLGDWMSHCTYAVLKGNEIKLEKFEG